MHIRIQYLKDIIQEGLKMEIISPSSEWELLRILSEAEEDVENGRVAPIQDTFDDIRESLSCL